MPQLAIAVAFGVGAVALASIFLWVAISTRREALPVEQVSVTAYQVQKGWFVVLIGVMVIVLSSSWPRLPYAVARLSHFSLDGNPLVITVRAYQYGWQMRPRPIAPGGIVRFDVTSTDVNHNFAIYNSADRLIGQVQAMPNSINSLLLRLPAGMYTIRCLELCGIGHHGMAMGFCVGACSPT